MDARSVTYQRWEFEQVTQPLQAWASTSVKCGTLWVTVEMEMRYYMESTWKYLLLIGTQ